MDGGTDAQKNNVAVAQLTKMGSDLAILVEFHPVILEEIVLQTNGQMMDARMDTQKNNIALTQPLLWGEVM